MYKNEIPPKGYHPIPVVECINDIIKKYPEFDKDDKRSLMLQQINRICVLFLKIRYMRIICRMANDLNRITKALKNDIENFWCEFTEEYKQIQQTRCHLILYDYLHQKPSQLKRLLKPRWYNPNKGRWKPINEKKKLMLQEIHELLSNSNLKGKELYSFVSDKTGRTFEAIKQIEKRLKAQICKQ